MMAESPLFAEVASSLSHYLVWSGLFALLLAPAVLARTRWSESPPLLICVSLSVAAHLLLTIYAYAIRLPHIDAGPGGGGDPAGEVVIALQLLEESEAVAAADSPASPSSAIAPPAPMTSAANATLSPPEELDETAADAQPADAMPANEKAADARAADKRASEPPPAALARSTPAPRDAAEINTDDTQDEAASTVPDATSAKPPAQEPPAQEPPTIAAAIKEPKPVADIASPAAGPVAADAPMPADRELAQAAKNEPPASPITAPPIAAPPAAASMADIASASAPPAPPLPALPPSLPSAAAAATAEAVPLAYRNRQANRRYQTALRQGGSAETEAAVEAALDFLVANQSPEGVWSAAATGAGREARVLGQDRGGAGAHADAGLTALALLAFLGAGETHLEGPRRVSVQRGLEYLLRIQRADGELAGSADLFARMYCHGMATLAVSEAYALTGDARLRPALEAAVGFTVRAQDPQGGGWRYRPGDAGDTSQFGWQVMSLKSAELAGLPIPAAVWERARRFLRTVSSGADAGLASYRPGERPSRTMTAEALFCRILLDDSPPALAREALRFVAQEPPGVGPDNHYYWYYGTLAQFQTQSDSWRTWNEALQRQLLARQLAAGPLRGSWDPDPVWGTHGGRVFSTALCALSLEVYYRYLPLYQTARLGSR